LTLDKKCISGEILLSTGDKSVGTIGGHEIQVVIFPDRTDCSNRAAKPTANEHGAEGCSDIMERGATSFQVGDVFGGIISPLRTRTIDTSKLWELPLLRRYNRHRFRAPYHQQSFHALIDRRIQALFHIQGLR
jgi:hypothetical protein